MFRYANTRIGDFEHRVGLVPPQAERDAATQCELERVREQIEDDFLPHFAIDVDGLAKRVALHVVDQVGSLHGRAKGACKIASQNIEVGCFVGDFDSTCLDAREVEQCVDEFQQA